jgi:hypothetical protein
VGKFNESVLLRSANGISAPHGDDGNHPGGLLGGQRCRRIGRVNYIDLDSGQLGRVVSEPLDYPLLPSILNDDVLSFNPTEVVQRLTEDPDPEHGLVCLPMPRR